MTRWSFKGRIQSGIRPSEIQKEMTSDENMVLSDRSSPFPKSCFLHEVIFGNPKQEIREHAKISTELSEHQQSTCNDKIAPT